MAEIKLRQNSKKKIKLSYDDSHTNLFTDDILLKLYSLNFRSLLTAAPTNIRTVDVFPFSFVPLKPCNFCACHIKHLIAVFQNVIKNEKKGEIICGYGDCYHR